MNLIERVHSKWGVVKLEARAYTYHHTGKDFHTVQFYYPSGEFMGEWDEERGGGLSHPNEAVDNFLSHTDIVCFCGRDMGLLDLDEAGYLELEEILTEEVNRIFPKFLVTCE